MPGRLRQSTGKSSEPATPARTYNITGLDFHEALTWRAGKAIAVADLLSRLQNLGTELRNLDQGQVAAQEFTRLAQDLAHSNLLGHKDKGVRAWVLCCIVDILNTCAPDAPFGPAQLKDIFTVVVNTILPALANPSNAYNSQHVYILNSLTDTKSIVLITDLENSDSLIIPLFTICFDIVSGAGQTTSGVELAKSVEFQLRSMLVTIIDEANLPQEATDIILSQFLRVDPRTTQENVGKSKKHTEAKDKKQDTLHLKDYPPAYNMAKSICTTCPDKMTVHVTQYFGNIIMNASATLEDEGNTKHANRRIETAESDDEDESLLDLRKAHRLMRELWRACPDVLQNVVPQVETELAADSIALRQLATETLGDIIAGIGISGPPPTSTLDPAAYPLPSIEDPEPAPLTTNPLLIAASPKPFGSIHGSAFQAFLGRRMDKAPAVRGAWTVAASRILLTDAGGIGLTSEFRDRILSGYAQMMRDIDDKVRLAAIQTVSQFDYHGVINVLGSDGGLSKSDTVISALAERVSDRKTNVREEAMLSLGRMWGVGSRDIREGVEGVVTVLGGIPSRLLGAMFINDLYTHMLLDKVIHESLLPLSFPPIKAFKSDGQKQRGKDKASQSQDATSVADPDHIRVERILTMVRSLDPKARMVFFGMQKRQSDMSKAIKVFLKTCEDYNGGIVDADADEQALKDALTRYIQQFAKQFSDATKATKDLWKFAEMHDRRNYQLIKFAIGPEHDYRTMTKAIKELTKRIREGPSNSQTLVDTLQPLLYRCALVIYNRSHVPAIMDISRSDKDGLADTAHEMLKEISSRNPEVLKSHIQALCKELEEDAPSADNSESASAPETLKACAGFARKYPDDVPKDRKFLTALINYALWSRTPRAAKHAVSILLTVSEKKELHAKELMTKAVKDCKTSSPQYHARLATISQVCLLAPAAASAEDDAILRITVTDCLHKNQTSSSNDDTAVWEAVPSDETVAKELALKIMVNRCRSANEKEHTESFDVLAKSVLGILMRLIEEDGEMTPTENTSLAQRNRLRLAAVRYVLKLCSHKRRCEELVTSSMFKSVALIVINPPIAVRTGLVQQLQKYLGRGVLHNRWYTIFFLLAFEPDTKLKDETVAWLRSRVLYFARQQKEFTASGKKVGQQTVMESIFARLLSLLAHHPDYPSDSEDFAGDLTDFARYIVLYLQAVANDENLSLIFHIAQRVKQAKDSITNTEEACQRLYVLSDLAQAVIRNYADLMPAHAKGVNLLQTWPGRVTLPLSLFSALPSHTVAQDIAAKNFLPEETAMGLERLVRTLVRSKSGQTRRAQTEKKRRNSESVDPDDDDIEEMKRSAKKARKSSLPIRRTPKVKRKAQDTSLSIEQPSRKSARVSTTSAVNYAESDEDMDDMPVPSSPIARMKSSTREVKKPKEPSLEAVEEEGEATPRDEEENEEEIDDEDAQPEGADDEDESEAAEHANGDDVSEHDEMEDVQENIVGTEEENEAEEASEREETPSPAKEVVSTRATRGKARGDGDATKPASASVKTKKVAGPKGKGKDKSTKAPSETAATPTTRRSTRSAKT